MDAGHLEVPEIQKKKKKTKGNMAPPLLDVPWGDSITFSLNGQRVVLRRPRTTMKLIEYLRDVAHLSGTKLSCGEGGCGACTVVLCHRPLETVPFHANSSNNGDSEVVFRAVNACLFPVCALDGIEVFTVEGIGSSLHGYHAVQQRLAEANGTQCGFCTPGWVMNMYELLRKSKDHSTREIEDHFDGNLCRCTGYRPIFEAFHSFGTKNEHQESEEAPMKLAYDGEGEHAVSAVEEVLHGCDHLDDWLLVDNVEEGRRSICEAKCGHDQAHKCSSKYLELEDLIPRRSQAAIEAAAPYDASGEIRPSDFIVAFKPQPLKIEDVALDGKTKTRWYRPLNLDQLGAVFKENCLAEIAFVGGRTAHGVSKYYNSSAPYNRSTETPVQVELNYIAELKAIEVKAAQGHAVIGASVTINSLISFLNGFTGDEYDNQVLTELATLVQRVANNQVRNAGTWAGNLSLCRQHPSFVSDLVVGLMGAGVTLTLMDEKLTRQENVAIDQYLARPLSEFVMIVAMQLPLTPAMSGEEKQAAKRQRLSCYKVAQRPQNAHSHVNCAIWTSTRSDESPHVCVDVRIVFGGVCKYPSRFPQTEKYLQGAVLKQETVNEAIAHLEKELKTIGPSEAFGSPTFRVSVMKNLLYKALVATFDLKDLVDPAVASASAKLLRGVSSGTQSFKPNDATAPVSNAIPKLGAKLQASGEARFTVDKELPASSLYGAILYSKVALGTVMSIDPHNTTRAIDGVVDIIRASDIRGDNDISSGTKEELLFVPVGGVVRCIGEPIALVVATSPEVAEYAVAQCEVEYGPVPQSQLWPGQSDNTPILDIDSAIKAGSLGQKAPIVMGSNNVDDELKKAKHTLDGSLLLGAQKHFYMEPQVSVASLQEGGVFLVESSTQQPLFIQQQLASVLKVPYNAITVQVQRAGGGFGGKLTRCVVNAAAAAVAAQKHRRTVRVLNDRSADFRLVGGREGMRGSYRIGFDDDGYIKALDLQLDVDCGYTVGDSGGSAFMAVNWSDSAYKVAHAFRCRAFLYLTNTQTCTSLRAPGVPQSLLLYEAALHHVAEYLKLPMQWVQERNMYKNDDVTPYGQVLQDVRFHEVWDRLLVSSSIEQREQAIRLFNSNNKWKKRGIAMTPTKYGMMYKGRKDGARVEIFAGDGSIMLSHGGCEIGQGIHTKVVQVCAFELGVPLESISVRATSTDQIPNSDATGGSSTSESVAQAIIECCRVLNERLAPIRAASEDKLSWTELVAKAFGAGVCLFAGAQPWKTTPRGDMFDYFVYAAACSEVEVDILTGEINIVRSELVYDCGISLNPAVDLGQIEGGFIMGVGLYLQEEVAYNATSGELLTQGTWEYKVPCSKDIPEQFKVTLLENAHNKSGVLNSKATGEPPYALAASVYFAVKKALIDSRSERGIVDFLQLDVPATVARRQDAVVMKAEDYTV